MSKKIVGVLRPFDLKQNFYVYKDGNKIEDFSITIEEIPKIIVATSTKYGIYQLDLTGPKQFASGVKNQILQEELLKNNANKLQIKII